MSDAARSTEAVIIFGATSMIGREIAARFAADGNALVLTGRDTIELDATAADLRIRYQVTVGTVELDILRFDEQRAVLDRCYELAGDALQGAILCIGYLPDQAKAAHDPIETRRAIETNFTGCVTLLNDVATRLAERQRGFICGISSVAGDRGRGSNYIYGASKAGLSAYLQGLRNHLHPTGVRVITIKPGFVDTRMIFGRPGVILAAAPARIATGVHRAIRRGRDVAYLPWFWRWIMLAIRMLPESIFKRLHI
jgi:short-subunit dehydrogenase